MTENSSRHMPRTETLLGFSVSLDSWQMEQRIQVLLRMITMAGFSAQALQLDGGFLIGDGDLFSANSNKFTRLLPSGLVDTSFNVNGSGFQRVDPGRINGIRVLSDGKIMIGGIFDTVNGISQKRIARLNSDSSVNSIFKLTPQRQAIISPKSLLFIILSLNLMAN